MNHDRMNRRALLQTTGALALASATTVFAAAQAKKPRVIRVVAKKFEFVPAEIHVRQGEAISLLFTAPEVPMGFNLADFQLRADIVPGKVARVDFTPDKAGRFTFLCDVFCGSGHEEMSGTLVVT
jgi:cytochrome c oxidase subunit 2